MRIEEDEILLRVFISEADRLHGKPLYEQIVMEAKELGIRGVTVLKGILGYGFHHHIHTSKLLALSDDLPIVIEIVDEKENVNRILPFIDSVVKEGLVTLETVHIIKYRE